MLECCRPSSPVVWGPGGLICQSSSPLLITAHSACSRLAAHLLLPALELPATFFCLQLSSPAVCHSLFKAVLQRALYICKSKYSVELQHNWKRASIQPQTHQTLRSCFLRVAVWLCVCVGGDGRREDGRVVKCVTSDRPALKPQLHHSQVCGLGQSCPLLCRWGW